VEVRTNALTDGRPGSPSSTPVLVARNQRSHQATISGTRSIRGPGAAVLVDAWAHGPASSRCGTPWCRSASTVRKELLP